VSSRRRGVVRARAAFLHRTVWLAVGLGCGIFVPLGAEGQAPENAGAPEDDAGDGTGDRADGPPPQTDGDDPERDDSGRAEETFDPAEVEADGIEDAPDRAPTPPAAAPPPAEPTGPAVPRTVCHGRRVRRIRVLGNQRVAEGDVLATIDLAPGGPCDDPQVARDAQALWNLGFFADIVVEAEAVGDEVDLIFRLQERPAIADIVFEGTGGVAKADIEEKVELREGSILSVPEVKRQVGRIRDLYAEKGFFLARVDYELVEEDNNQVDVVFQIQEGDKVSVRRVRFVGNDNVAAGDLRGFMQTSEEGFFSFLSEGASFSRDIFEEDLVRLQAIYYDRGYLGVRIGTPRVELTPDRRHIDITVPIDEGPRFRIGRLAIEEVDAEGNSVEPLGGRRRLREQIAANPGDWFSRTAIAESLQRITRYYRDEGYAAVEMVPQTDLDAAARKVDVVLRIRRGPLVTIERIEIKGNSKTRDEVIRREVVINEGELYSQSKIERSQARIQALGYFERADVSEEEGSSPDQIVLTIEVAERPTGTFQVGAGFSSIESFIFTAQIQQDNLFGRGQNLSLNLQISGIRQLIQVRFVEPYLFGTEWTGAGELFRTIRQFGFFTRDSTGGSLTIGHPVFDNRLRFFLTYRADFVNVNEGGQPLFGRTQAGRFFVQNPLNNLFQDGLTSSLRASLVWDSRDNRLFTRQGIHASLSTEVADPILASDNVFIRHQAFFRWYYPLFGGSVLKMNTEWGLITSRGEEGVPLFERFFLGGIFNVRGFQLNRLGPRVNLPVNIDPTLGPRSTPIGGNMQFFYNLEFEFPILEQVGIKGVLFTDGGNAWNLNRTYAALPQSDPNDPSVPAFGADFLDLRHSWGFGVRWLSPLGPLRFEWGLPIDRQAFEDPIVFEFTIGNFF